MITAESLEVKLERSLKRVIPDMTLEVVKNDHYMYFVTIISPMFEEMDEADRQSLVLERVLADFDPYEQRSIEFFFTHAPSELEPASTGLAESTPRNE